MELSVKHKAFCDEYLANGMNALQAYKSVYKCSDKAAQSNAFRLMENKGVILYIQKQQEKTAEKLEITRDYIINEYLELINSAKGNDDYIDRTNWNKSLAQLSKLLGLDAPSKQEITHEGISINIIKPDGNNL